MSFQIESPINAALRNLEATEANLSKLERIFSELTEITPRDIAFGSDPKYEQGVRSYKDVLSALPEIDGWKPKSIPPDLNDLAQWRLDAKEVGEISAEIAVDNAIDEPGKELAEYRHRLNKIRRQLIRSAMQDRMADIDDLIRNLRLSILENVPANELVSGGDWDRLNGCVQEIETLLGSTLPRPVRWSDLRRHLSFGMAGDFRDIVQLDWPSVKSGLSKGLYDQNEPIPVEVADLAVLARTQPQGAIATKLKWESLNDDGFERLIFLLISSTSGYENPGWLMRTNAADRGRDLSVTRITQDRLSGTIRSRVLIQCRHWLQKSISAPDVAALKEQILLWEPPKVEVLIIATSGRFTSDAVMAIEKHNNGDKALRIEMWAESHLELLLAERPDLIGEFKLR